MSIIPYVVGDYRETLRIFGVIRTGFAESSGHLLTRNRENSREKCSFPRDNVARVVYTCLVG